MLLDRSSYGMLPIYGDNEVAVGVRPDRKSVAIHQSGETFSAETPGILPHYKITHENADYLAEQSVKLKIEQVFEATPGSVAERVKRGLGWLARARQVSDQAERVLYFSTSIETLLTLEDKDAKVTDNIARNESIILSDNIDTRSENYGIILNCYEVRSRIIHGGSRNVSRREARLIQEVAELLYSKIVLLTNLSVKYETFQASLKQASFGAAWTGIVVSAPTQ